MATAVRRRWAPSATAALGRWWEPLALAALILAFVGITLWWLGADGRAPDYDEGRHLGFALDFHDAFDRGDLTYWFNTFTQYPPFVHLVGALGFLLGPLSVNSPVVAQNLFFLPLLAIGCYGAGSVAYGRRAGVLAAVFALATPMVIDQFHEFMVDAPTAAMVAVTVWLILASRRFERWPIAALAGLAAGLGQMCKAPFVLFIAGFALVVLVRGGWRNWRGVLAFVVVGAAVVGPWYVHHWDQLRGLSTGAVATPGGGGLPGTIMPARYSKENLLWYFWNLVNIQVLLPLALLFAVGAGAAAVRFVRRRRADDYAPELLAGAVSSYLAVSYLSLKDARYSLPMIVFLAVLGTWWLARLRAPWSGVGAAGLAAILVLNTLAVSFGVGGKPWRVTFLPHPPHDFLARRQATIWNHGYILGGPQAGGHPERLLRAAKRARVQRVAFDAAGPLFFNGSGLIVLARIVGEPFTTQLNRLTFHDLLFVAHPLDPRAPPPCALLEPGTGIYGTWNFPAYRFTRSAFHCPAHA